jgi:hypothetical protein
MLNVQRSMFLILENIEHPTLNAEHRMSAALKFPLPGASVFRARRRHGFSL